MIFLKHKKKSSYMLLYSLSKYDILKVFPIIENRNWSNDVFKNWQFYKGNFSIRSHENRT